MLKCGNPNHMCPLGECFENSEMASQDDVYLQLYWFQDESMIYDLTLKWFSWIYVNSNHLKINNENINYIA